MPVANPEHAARAYEIQLDSLMAHQARGFVWLRSRAIFRGLTDAEIIEELGRARELLDQAGVLAVVAAIEAVLRQDFLERARRGGAKRKVPLNRDFRKLAKRFEKVAFYALLDVWKGHVGAGHGPIGRLKQAYKRRHWLAHGGYFPDKSGVAPDVQDIIQIWRDLTLILRSCADDFPRS